MIHPTAQVQSVELGPGTSIGAFVLVDAGARLGAGVVVEAHAQVHEDVIVGDGCRIGAGVQLWPGCRLEEGVVLGAGVGFVRQEGSRTWLRHRAQVGENATIAAGITLGVDCQVRPGAVVTRDVPPNAIVSGHPARIIGYRDAPELPLVSTITASQTEEPPALHARGARLIRLPKIVDLRGALSFGEIGAQLPFTPQRFFVVYDVPSQEVRGEHAHRACHQFLVCVKGRCAIVVDDGTHRDEVLLDSARLGLHLSPLVWGIQYRFSPDAVLLALASDCYDAADYIRNYDEFLVLARGD